MRFINTLLISSLLLVISTKSAHAYLDPGTGSFILQVLAAGALGGLFAIKTFWHNITGFFSNIFSKGKETEKQSSAPTKRSNGKNR